MFDIIIIGAGPAGLSAALVLGRCRRRVLVCDAGSPRNRASHALHGFLTRDGIDPADLLRIGREQLARYGSVEVCDIEVTDAIRFQDRFEITLSDGSHLSSLKLLLATGIVDQVPEIEGSNSSMAAVYSTARTATAGKCAINQSLFTAAESAVMDSR